MATKKISELVEVQSSLDADSLVIVQSGVTNKVSKQNFLKSVGLVSFSETVVAPAISAGALTLDLSAGTVFAVAHNANITNLSISNIPASGRCGSFTLVLTQDATGGRTVTFPAAIKWASGSAPTLTTTANKANVLTFFTLDGGTTWFGAQTGKDYA